MSGGAVRALGSRIGRLYLAACAVVYLIASGSFLVVQHARAVAEAEAACANLSRVVLDEIGRSGCAAAGVMFERKAMRDATLRVTSSGGVTLASEGDRLESDLTAGAWGEAGADGLVYVEVGYRRPALAEPGDLLMIAAGGILAGAFALLTRGPLVRSATAPVEGSIVRQREFIAAASHELKSPLSVVMLDLEAIRASNGDAGRVELLTKEGARECSRMAGLVEDLLALASGDTEGWELRLVRCDAAEIILDAYEQMEDKAASMGRPIEVSLPAGDDEATVLADPARAAQALRALIENALEYAPEGTPVGVALSVSRGQAVLSVSDRGPGVPDDLKERIFDRFYRADPAGSDRDHHGLGLAIAREIAEGHGGSLKVRDNTGGGAVFELSLPLAR